MSKTLRIPLVQLAHARSGDKADWVDFGLFAWNEAGYRIIEREVTAAKVQAHFAPWLPGQVDAWCCTARCKAAAHATCVWTTWAKPWVQRSCAWRSRSVPKNSNTHKKAPEGVGGRRCHPGLDPGSMPSCAKRWIPARRPG
jgi:hypothetical protein